MTCLALKIPRAEQYAILKKAPEVLKARLGKITVTDVAAPRKGVKRFIFTCAQNDTPIVAPFWRNLIAYQTYLDAELHVVGFAYNPTIINPNYRKFDDCVTPYLTNTPVNVGDKLTFCAEISITPTAVQPLSGFETYTRDKWGVFPHPRIALQSVPTPFDQTAKQIMTTGCVTHPNYIHSKAGMKAQFHHIASALLVELDSDGDVFCRHLISDDTGSFYDLDTHVANGKVLPRRSEVEAITWGDIHCEELDEVVRRASWGENGILDTLKPRHQFFHDIVDLGRRSHHNVKDPHFRFRMWSEGTESMQDAFNLGADFLEDTRRKWCKSYVVESNHDAHFARWLRETDFKDDPVNAQFYLEATTALYASIKGKNKNFSVFEWALPVSGVKFLSANQGFKICNDNKRGIECAIHGHDGANGAKGHIMSFAKMGSKANVGHTHSAAIYEGIYQAGTSSKLDLEYNRGGLSSWNHAHIITYKNGKRVIVTLVGDKWRAR